MYLKKVSSGIYNLFHACKKRYSLKVILSCRQLSFKVKDKYVGKALEPLDSILPRIIDDGGERRHCRLIQMCMKDILDVGSVTCSKHLQESVHKELDRRSPVAYDAGIDTNFGWRMNISFEEDPQLLLLELRKRGQHVDEGIICSVSSSIGFTGEIKPGLQLHAYCVKVGFDKLIPVGSSLISLYSKCRQLLEAYRVFEDVTMKDTISWTAIIAGYAQEWQVETCINLFICMCRSGTIPNDFTFASLLSACTSNASLAFGRCVHSLEIRMGFDNYTHISNALISMYAKCGSISEACYVFEKMPYRDHISWNSMIFGYSQYGLAEPALTLLRSMNEQNVLADAITYLGVLSSCRHAGLVEQGRKCFNWMLKDGIRPNLDHYSCIADLLGRSGLLQEAFDFIVNMPIPPNAVMWGSLLSSARVHRNIWIGIQAAENRLLLEPGCAATHVQLANLYASVGHWNHAARVRKLMKDRGLKTTPGYSWIEIGNEVYRFRTEDTLNAQVDDILNTLISLEGHLKDSSNVGWTSKLFMMEKT